MQAPRRPFRAPWIALALALVAGACSGGPGPLPDPRPIVIPSGERLRLDPQRADSINEWVLRERDNIENDPSFWVVSRPAFEPVYVWEGLDFGRDSVFVRVEPGAGGDSGIVHEIYGHLHLMVRMGRQEEWLPEAPDAEGYELERAILKRVADAWLLGRTVFDTAPYAPLDELVFASEAGFLDAFIFTARPDEFAQARAEWARANPDEADRYRSWFLQTFNREPPGLRPS